MLDEIYPEKIPEGFQISNKWKILKRFAGTFHQVQASFFLKSVSAVFLPWMLHLLIWTLFTYMYVYIARLNRKY